MKKIYMVSYDLKKPGQDYSKLFNELKSSPKWWHFIDSSWLIRSEETPNEIWERISPCIDQNDRVLIIEVANNYQGWLPKKAWDWIKDNLGEG